MDTKEHQRPPFDSLPLRRNGPHGNAWGLFGERDQLGMLNLLNPENTIAATKEIVQGLRISTDLPLDKFKTPLFKRDVFQQTIRHKSPRTVNDDTFSLIPSRLRSGMVFVITEEKLYFNGLAQKSIDTTKENGIHVWVENGGIIGRGVLLDYHAWATAAGIPHPAFESTSISLSHLLATAESQKVTFRRGDILFIRSGYGAAYNSLSTADIEVMAESNPPASMGVQSSEEILRWFWDTGFAAVAGDMLAFEAWPCQDTRFWLHEWLLAGWGMPIGELFDLERLAEECRKVGKWTFFFSSVPLNVPGGVASPPNGMAIL